MKRIILTVTTDLVYDQRMQRICTSLSGAGYDVLLVGRRKKSTIPLPENPYRQKRLWCRWEHGKLFYLEYNVRLFFFLLFRKADILTAIDLDSILAVSLAGWIKRRIRVYDAHEYFTETPEVVRRPGIKRIWEWVAKKCIPAMDACYTVGPALAGIMGERYQTTFHVVRNVPFCTTSEIEAVEDALIFYQGALNEGRGLEKAIRAIALLPEPFKLELAGEGDLSGYLRELCDELGLQDRVRFLGYVRPDELRTRTPRAWLGLNLLENTGLSYYYSLANKAFDYTSAGVPSLQMDFPEYRRLQEEFACFVLLEQLDPELIASSILNLWNKQGIYRDLRTNCRMASHEWIWEKEEERLLAIYKNLNMIQSEF